MNKKYKLNKNPISQTNNNMNTLGNYNFLPVNNTVYNINNINLSSSTVKKYKQNLQYLLEIRKIWMKKLAIIRLKRHNTNKHSWNIRVIDDIIYNEKSHLVSIFKDYLIYDDNSEFMKRFYSIKESSIRIPKIVDYYINNTSFMPNYSIMFGSKFIIKAYKKKQKIKVDEDKGNIKEKEKIKSLNLKVANKEIEERIFTETLNKSIDNIHPSISHLESKDSYSSTQYSLNQIYLNLKSLVAVNEIVSPSNKIVGSKISILKDKFTQKTFLDASKNKTPVIVNLSSKINKNTSTGQMTTIKQISLNNNSVTEKSNIINQNYTPNSIISSINNINKSRLLKHSKKMDFTNYTIKTHTNENNNQNFTNERNIIPKHTYNNYLTAEKLNINLNINFNTMTHSENIDQHMKESLNLLNKYQHNNLNTVFDDKKEISLNINYLKNKENNLPVRPSTQISQIIQISQITSMKNSQTQSSSKFQKSSKPKIERNLSKGINLIKEDSNISKYNSNLNSLGNSNFNTLNSKKNSSQEDIRELNYMITETSNGKKHITNSKDDKLNREKLSVNSPPIINTKTINNEINVKAGNFNLNKDKNLKLNSTGNNFTGNTFNKSNKYKFKTIDVDGNKNNLKENKIKKTLNVPTIQISSSPKVLIDNTINNNNFKGCSEEKKYKMNTLNTINTNGNGAKTGLRITEILNIVNPSENNICHTESDYTSKIGGKIFNINSITKPNDPITNLNNEKQKTISSTIELNSNSKNVSTMNSTVKFKKFSSNFNENKIKLKSKEIKGSEKIVLTKSKINELYNSHEGLKKTISPKTNINKFSSKFK